MVGGVVGMKEFSELFADDEGKGGVQLLNATRTIVEVDSTQGSCASYDGIPPISSSTNKSIPTPTPVPVSINTNYPLQQTEPAYILKNEQAKHRLILEYIAKGYDDREVARLMGISGAAVAYVRKQPKYQGMLLDELKRKVNEDQEVVEVIRKNVAESVRLYEKILIEDKIGDEKVSLSMKMEAAERFLNRRYGKPNQPINRGTDVDLNSLSDADLAKMLPETQQTGTSK